MQHHDRQGGLRAACAAVALCGSQLLACSGSDSGGGGNAEFARRAATSERLGELLPEDVQPALGEACPEGSFLRGWDARRGAALCQMASTLPGEPGPEGAMGATGATGVQGESGPAGSEGPSGPAGATGATGPAGPPGGAFTWLGSFSTAPVGPSVNDAYRDTTQGGSFFFDGAAWQRFSQDGANGTNGTNGAPGTNGSNGISLNWLGSLASAPASPSLNDAYYDTTDGIAYVYSTGSWQTLAQDGMQGPQGSEGPEGPIGPGGPMGPQGVTGAPAPGGSGTVYGSEAASFAGFSGATYDGGRGGRAAMHAACATAFPGSHLCHAAEYLLAGSATSPPIGGAWLDASYAVTGADGSHPSSVYGSKDSGRYGGKDSTANCSNWTSNASNVDGYYVAPDGIANDPGFEECNLAKPLACCDTPTREQFAGFTVAIYDGARGGRAGMHAACGLEYPGSHLCHASEYLLANSATNPPAQGAWLDASVVVDGSGTSPASQYGVPSGARLGTKDSGANCSSWTSNAAIADGYYVVPDGIANDPGLEECNLQKPLACCLRR